VGRAALGWDPIDNLKIVGSIFYQDVSDHDREQYWSATGNAGSDNFKQGARLRQPITDKFNLPALKIQYDWPSMSLVSNTSYFDHSNDATLDYTTFLAGIYYGDPLQYLPGDVPSLAYVEGRQNAFTQEVRLQSTGTDNRIDWTVGVFYSDMKQISRDVTINGQIGYTSVNGDIPSFTQNIVGKDKELAGYLNLDFNVTSALKLTAGLRASKSDFDFLSEGTFGGFPLGTVKGTQSEQPVTPRLGVSYQLDADNFLYATAAKGFRQGGVNASVPPGLCDADLAALGLTTTPESYSADSLWSYEIGAKDNFFDGRLNLDSSLYLIKWSDIQESVRLPSCSFAFVGNLGAATGVGGNVSARFRLTDGLAAGISAGYVDLTYDETVYQGANAILVEKGDKIGGPPFQASAWAVYNFKLADHDSYVRVDYTHQNDTPAPSSQSFSYDPTLPIPAALSVLSMRAGMTFGAWQFSLYGSNLTNEDEPIGVSHEFPGSVPYYVQSLRPLTIGVTAEYRY
jgi:outer membrane receptor protein involved in Fe transport